MTIIMDDHNSKNNVIMAIEFYNVKSNNNHEIWIQ